MAFESDWAFLQAALPDLQDYIISSEIYWTLRPSRRVIAGGKLPQLTIGNLLLSLARLSALTLTDAQKSELAEIEKSIQQVRQSWLSNWSNKAEREFSSRLNLWQQYMRELRGEPRQQANYYHNEVRMRAILQLLRSEIRNGAPQNEEEQLSMLDQILRGLTLPGPFVWEQELASGFPQDVFWFLYVTPKQK